ncbi:glycosyltransferase family 1 protein [Vibrio aquaticus]|uniref:Glycosyltransferase family 1 protein n=1 Tax=Vibrio aquaticus TaxID=2496559 RepID=A0A3S0QEJ1_9VIBR|nr:glycosyltransferase [Vibrio aquaticus]RTZ16800.1 glycosyltransferase family 1 protein [Vibrio aquaticus]
MRDLIVFGEDFGGLPSSTQHLITRLAQYRKVLWVNSIGLRQPKWTTQDIKRAALKLMGKGKSGYQTSKQLPSNITVVNLRTIPAPSSMFARQAAKMMLCRQLKPLIKRLKLNNPILWSSLPTAADLCGHLGESAVVYYCGDDFASLAGVDHQTVAEHESKLIEKADLIFAASSKLVSKFPQAKTHYVPHGVDTQLFSTPTARASDLPDPCHKIAGFYGSLSNWLDYEMIEKVCRTNSDWQFVFIGPIELTSNPLPKLNNVHYLGPRPHHELPSYSQHWDVSLLPFLANDQIAACSPLKLLEYLAAKSKVISTPFPALTPYSEHVDVVTDADGFSLALARIATTASPNRSVSEMSINRNSWDERSQQVQHMLESL